MVTMTLLFYYQQILTSLYFTAVEPQYGEPLYNKVPGMTNDILQPGQSDGKLYGTEILQIV